MPIDAPLPLPPNEPRPPQVTIEILYFTGCPHAAHARAMVRTCVAQLGIDAQIIEREGDHPSPSVLVSGTDVMGATDTTVRACRREVPTEAAVIDALRAATRGDAR